jgi:hypothetical protein
MLVRLRLVMGSLLGAAVVLVAVCLGAQNLTDRPSLRLGVAQTAPLPSGFLLGLALSAGLVSGGAIALVVGDPDEEGPDGY